MEHTWKDVPLVFVLKLPTWSDLNYISVALQEAHMLIHLLVFAEGLENNSKVPKVKYEGASIIWHSFISDLSAAGRGLSHSSINSGIKGRMDCEGHATHTRTHTHTLSHLHRCGVASNGFKICSSEAAFDKALWFMYSTQRLWEGMFRVFNHRITSLFLPPLMSSVKG